MLDQLQWSTLQDRRTDSRLTMFYKIVNEKVSIPKTDRLNPPLSDFHATCTHFHFKYLHAEHNSDKILFPRTIKDWNHLPLSTVMSGSVESFKAAVSTSTYNH